MFMLVLKCRSCVKAFLNGKKLYAKNIMKLRLKTTIFIATVWFFFFNSSCYAQFALIRDAQTEKFLRELCDPIFVSAKLNPDDISIYVVNDSTINAFVSGGQNIFINTGLIRKYETPNALIGVVAHEVGHITSGHIARSSEEIQSATTTMFLSYLLGIGAVIAGSPEAGQGIILGGSDFAQKLYLKFSRTQEEAADRHALQYLEKIDYPPSGLVELLEFFETQNRGYQGQINEYAQSHPISRKRIDYLKSNIKKKSDDKKINQKLQPQMNIVLAKLEAFIDNPDLVIKKYENDESEIANYEKAIAFYRKGKTAQALELLDKIILENKNDGFLYELKAQILYESNNVSEAILVYKKAIDLLSNRDSSQAKIYFATAILSLKNNDLSLIKMAIKNLKEAQKFENDNPFLFKQFANAYNKIGDEARSFAALAEYNFLVGDTEKAQKYGETAKEKFEENKNNNSAKSDLLRLDDLLELIKNDKKSKNKT